MVRYGSALKILVLLAHAQNYLSLNIHVQLASIARGLMLSFAFIFFNTLCLSAAKALTGLHICTGLSELSLLANVISTKIKYWFIYFIAFRKILKKHMVHVIYRFQGFATRHGSIQPAQLQRLAGIL